MVRAFGFLFSVSEVSGLTDSIPDQQCLISDFNLLTAEILCFTPCVAIRVESIELDTILVPYEDQREDAISETAKEAPPTTWVAGSDTY